MMRIWLFGVVAVPMLIGQSSAQTPDPYAAKVQALAHPRYQEREKAARDLVAVGEPALKALRAAASSSDAEVRARAAAIAERIDRVVRSERLLAAPKIAIKLDKVPLQQAVIDVGRKTGLRFQLEPSKDADFRRPVTLDTGEKPFWEAIADFYAAAGLMENFNPPAGNAANDTTIEIRRGQRMRLIAESRNLAPGTIRLTDGKSTMIAANTKAIRIRALPANFAQNKFDAATGELTFNLRVDGAPALSVQEIIGVEVRRATGDNRQALAPAYPAPLQSAHADLEMQLIAQQIALVNGDLVMQEGYNGGPYFPATLKPGGTKPRMLSELEGVVVARVIAPPEPLVTVDNIFGKGRTETADGLSMTVLSAEAGKAGEVVVRIRVTVLPDESNEVLNFPVAVKGQLRPFVRINRGGGAASTPSVPEFRLRDSSGTPFKLVPAQSLAADVDGLGTSEYRLTFKKPVGSNAKELDAMSLSIYGRKSVLVEMPFVLKNVPMP
jgi:hypothetical protein